MRPGVACAAAGAAPAQPAYPVATVTLVTHSGPGGGSDVFLRTLARHLAPKMGVNFAIENLSGGSGARAVARVAQAPADGSVLYATTPTYIQTTSCGRWSSGLRVRGHPLDRGLRLRQSFLVSREHLARVAMEREPSFHVLGVPPVLLVAVRAVVAQEDVDAMVTGGTVEGGQDPGGHFTEARSPEVDEAKRSMPGPATPPCRKALFCPACGVKGDADDDKHDAEHSNGGDEFHFDPAM